MPLSNQFYPESIEIIKEALTFVILRIEEYSKEKLSIVDESHHGVVQKAYDLEIQRVKNVLTYVEKNAKTFGFLRLNKKSHQSLMNIIRSALEIYLQDTLRAQAKTGLSGFDDKIQEIRRIMGLHGPKIGNPDLFRTYYTLSAQVSEGGETEIFFSYSHKDKILAGKIADLLKERGIAVFLAHEQIEISKEWRSEIQRRLKSDNVLIALLTQNYTESIWANQEAGFMVGKGGKIIPLILGEIDVKRYGLIESYQGIQINENKIEESVEKIVESVTR